MNEKERIELGEYLEAMEKKQNKTEHMAYMTYRQLEETKEALKVSEMLTSIMAVLAIVVAAVAIVIVAMPEKVSAQAIGGTSQIIKLIDPTYYPTDEEIMEEQFYDSLEQLAICVQAEAGGESYLGKQMVAGVILNRVEDADWPGTIEEVISEPYEFSSYWDGGMAGVYEPSEDTFKAVASQLHERMYPELYYFTAFEYSEYGTRSTIVGNHYFSTK